MILSQVQDQDHQHNLARVLLPYRSNQRGNTETIFRRNDTQGEPQIIPIRNEINCARQSHQQRDLPRMGITPHNLISIEHQKHRGRAPEGCRKFINKQEGGTLYQKMCDL